ncbi:mapk-regulated corepressor-interacting protein 1-like [Cyprinus carpio]|uniref:Mapk-regulated corepressor-interacting protein 1-like n=1 Tax=Cyprinus carpio TaxID=7962 RepID=A0A9Q9Y7L5_CYPCA|nr:mapk-regulated corepressor-interacting protein 1-like [Cyprinus carpio]
MLTPLDIAGYVVLTSVFLAGTKDFNATFVVGSSPSLKMVQNYKQTTGASSPTNTEELLTPAHEENVRFIHYTWQRVMREMQTCQGNENNNQGPQKYVERTPNPALSCFTPLDLNDVKRKNTQDPKKSL